MGRGHSPQSSFGVTHGPSIPAPLPSSAQRNFLLFREQPPSNAPSRGRAAGKGHLPPLPLLEPPSTPEQQNETPGPLRGERRQPQTTPHPDVPPQLSGSQSPPMLPPSGGKPEPSPGLAGGKRIFLQRGEAVGAGGDGWIPLPAAPARPWLSRGLRGQQRPVGWRGEGAGSCAHPRGRRESRDTALAALWEWRRGDGLLPSVHLEIPEPSSPFSFSSSSPGKV